MKHRIEIYSLVLFILAAALLSMGFQEIRSTDVAEVERIFSKNCSVSGCHTGPYVPQGLNLNQNQFQASLVDMPSQEVPSLKLVNTQNPEQSYLLMKVKGSEGIVGERMSAYAPALEPEEISAVEKWILSLKGSMVKAGVSLARNQVRKPAFWGKRVVNLPTSRSIGKGGVLFRVSHRFFPAVKDGYDVFYGLDGPASVRLDSDTDSLTT